MKKYRKSAIISIVLIGVVTVISCAVFRYARPVAGNIHPIVASIGGSCKVRNIQFTAVTKSCYFEIVDENNRIVKFGILDPNGSRRVFIGDVIKMKNLIEIPEPRDTLLRLHELIRSDPDLSRRKDTLLFRISDNPRDYLIMIWRGAFASDEYYDN